MANILTTRSFSSTPQYKIFPCVSVYSKCGQSDSPCQHLCLLTPETTDFFHCQCSLGYANVPNVGCVRKYCFAFLGTLLDLVECILNNLYELLLLCCCSFD